VWAKADIKIKSSCLCQESVTMAKWSGPAVTPPTRCLPPGRWARRRREIWMAATRCPMRSKRLIASPTCAKIERPRATACLEDRAELLAVLRPPRRAPGLVRATEIPSCLRASCLSASRLLPLGLCRVPNGYWLPPAVHRPPPTEYFL